VNYLELIVGFHRWKEVNLLPASGIALWHELVAICNRAGWPEEFTVPNGALQANAGLSRKEFDRARQLLIEFGLIIYKKSNRVDKAGKYKINARLFKMDNERGNETDNGRDNGRDNDRDNETGNERGNFKELKDPKGLNGNKKKARAQFVTMTDEEYERLVEKYGQSDTEGIVESLNNYKGANGKQYKSDYHAVLKWAADAYFEKRKRESSDNDEMLRLIREEEERGNDQS